MPNEKPAKAATWSQIKNQLKDFNRQQLLALIKDLHDYSAQNRDFLAARFAPAESAALESYRLRISKCFPTRGFSDPKLREARAAIRQYQKATSDLSGTLDLMIAFVEGGTRYTNEYGDLWEGFYDSLASVLGEIAKHLTSPEGVPLYPRFEDRLNQLRRDTRNIGWGYGDDVSDCVQLCADAHEQWARAHSPQAGDDENVW